MAQSGVVKGLLVLLVASFAMWGIEDVFKGGVGDAAAVVGSQKISKTEIEEALRQELGRVRQMFGGEVPAGIEDAIRQDVLGRFVEQSLLLQDAQRLGIVTPDSQVVQVLAKAPPFQTEGAFDKQKFQDYLRNSGMSEAQFTQMVARDLSIQTLLEPFFSTVLPLEMQADLLQRSAQQMRETKLLRVSLGDFASVPNPDDEALAAYYESHKDQFATAAFRSAVLLSVTPDSVKDVTVSDQEIQDHYDQNQNLFLGEDNKTALPLADVKERIRDELLHGKKDQAMFALVNRIEDALAGGASLADAAKEVGLTVQDIGPVSERGASPSETFVENIPSIPGLLERLFALAEGEKPRLTPASEDSMVALELKEIIQPRIRTLDEVRASVVDAWKKAEKEKQIQIKAGEARQLLVKGTSIEEVSKGLGLSAPQLVTVSRMEANPSFPRPLLEDLFSRKVGEVSAIYANDLGDLLMGRVEKVISGPVPSEEEKQTFAKSLSQQVTEDALLYYSQYLRQKTPVEVYLKPTAQAEAQ